MPLLDYQDSGDDDGLAKNLTLPNPLTLLR